jgi:1-acyl-sn-glycerol-3-phosphate acyltransferase
MPDRSLLARSTDSAAREGRPSVGRLRGWANRSRERYRLRLVGPDFDERIGQLQKYYASLGGDVFGLDLDAYRSIGPLFGFLHRGYFRTEVHGIDRLPPGRVIIVANHSGQLPIDAMILGCSLFFDAAQPRVIRAMIDRWAASLPFVSTFFTRLGSVVGARDNARRLLDREEALLVFPEGVKGISKPFTQRYQLQEFGTGFMRIALETGAPILPVAVVGAEEQYINVGNAKLLASLLNIPACPIIPQMMLPFGQLPLPTKYRLFFGEPLRFVGNVDTDDTVVAENVFVVQKAIQTLLNVGLSQRRGVFT